MHVRDVEEGAAIVGKGGIVACPTDTLWGLAVDPWSTHAVERLREVTGSPEGKPFSVAVPRVADAVPLAVLDTRAWRIADALLPGPLTLVVPRRDRLPPAVTGGRDTVGIRVPDHPTVRALAAAAGPVTSTSANRHGEPPARSRAEVEDGLDGVVDGILDGAEPTFDEPSTVVAVVDGTVEILREGVVPAADVEGVL